jgi:hypothetical protein
MSGLTRALANRLWEGDFNWTTANLRVHLVDATYVFDEVDPAASLDPIAVSDELENLTIAAG